MHVLTADQFSKKDVLEIFASADKIKKALSNPTTRKKLSQKYQGRQLATLFYQPSTRTRTSFEVGALKFGMGVVSTENALESSSAHKGETMEDTARIVSGYGVDLIVIRSAQAGDLAKAASVSPVPVINAGDGRDGEHPTQSLFDSYTIMKNIGRLDNIKIVMGGDLKQSRTVRSLCKVLAKFNNNHIIFLSAPAFQAPKDVTDNLKASGVTFEMTSDMKKAFADADVIYWTRLQTEYIKNKKDLPKGGFVIDKNALKLMKKDAIIMHPLPRIDEITTDVDSDPRAKYFEEAQNGLYVRMALMDRILSSGK